MMKRLNWIPWLMVIALSILIIIQQRTINDYKLITQAYEKAGQEYQRTIEELTKERYMKKRISDKELAEQLHSAGLSAWMNYEAMGKSGEMWNSYRLEIARELNRRLVIKR